MLKPVAFYPLNNQFTTNDVKKRPQLEGYASNVAFTRGPYNETDGAYEFSGNSSSYIEFPNGDGILDVKYSITLMCWVRPEANYGAIFNYNKAHTWGIHIWIVNGRFFHQITKFGSYASLPHILTDQPLEVGKWTHVAATYNHITGVNSIYVNGMLIKTQNIGTGFRIATNDRAVRMGVAVGSIRHFKGAIAQMAVYSVALSAQQIRAVMYTGKA